MTVISVFPRSGQGQFPLDSALKFPDDAGMHADDKAALYRELGKLVRADFHLDRSLTLLLGQKLSPPRRRFLEGVQRGLQEGLGLAESVRLYGGTLATGLDQALIEAGERSGRLAQAFAHLQRYYEASGTAIRQMRGALVYPLILLHLALLLPEIPAAIAAEDGPGFVPRALWSLGLLWGVLLILFWLTRWLGQQARVSSTVDGFLNRIPLLGRARRHWALARFCQVFHASLLAALRVSEGCRLAGVASQSGQLRQAAERAAVRIENGQPLAASLASPAFDSMFLNAVATAEESGKLDEEMEHWASWETQNATDALTRLSIWLPRIGYGLVVIFVCYRIFDMVAGYYGGLLRQIEAF